MAFVKDDHSYSRGVGAIASMDAASPGRRIAAARAEREMVRRDAVAAAGAMRRDGGAPVRPTTRPTFTRPTSTVQTGQEAAFQQQPPTRSVPKLIMPRFSRGSGAAFSGRVELPRRPVVKLPGTVITPSPSPGAASPTQSATSAAAPSKSVVVGSGSGTNWLAPSRATEHRLPPADPTDDSSASSDDAVTPAPAKTSTVTLLLVAAGVGAILYFSKGR